MRKRDRSSLLSSETEYLSSRPATLLCPQEARADVASPDSTLPVRAARSCEREAALLAGVVRGWLLVGALAAKLSRRYAGPVDSRATGLLVADGT